MPRRPPPPERILRTCEALGVSPAYRKDGTPRLPKGADETLKETALGRLFARKHIEPHHYEAGQFFQDLAWRAWGRPFARAKDLEGVSGGAANLPCPDTENARQARKILFNLKTELQHELSNCGYWAYGSVLNLCEFDRDPPWIGEAPLTPGNADSRERLRRGLDTLADVIGIRKRNAA